MFLYMMSRLFMAVAAEMEGTSYLCLATKYAGRSKQTNKQSGVRQETGREGWKKWESFWGTMSTSSPETNAPADTLPYALLLMSMRLAWERRRGGTNR